MHVMKPFTPVTLTEGENTAKVGVWGRTYTTDARSFLSSIISKSGELLAAPIRFVLREDGEETVVDGGWQCFPMAGATEAEATVIAAAESVQFVLNVTMRTTFDGCVDTTLTVVPRGRSVAQCFGLEAMKPYEYRLDRLYMEIPLRREVISGFQYYPAVGGDVLASGGEISGAMALPFKEQIFLTGDEAGVMFFFETPEGFVPTTNPSAVEIIPEGDTILLRYRLLDGEPPVWRDQAAGRIDLDPISYRFGVMATPVKPMPERLFAERAVHIDCYKKILIDYETFLAEPFEGTDEVTFDRLARLGVNTLYIHEKWNDLQNSTVLTARTARRLRFIIDECHKRGIRVIPYFGYELSTLSPEYLDIRDEAWRFSRKTARGSWYRQPPQRNIRVCQKSSFSDRFCEGIARLMEEYKPDGIYLDGTAYVWPCMNEAHGCGYVDEEGNRRPSYPVWGTRKTMMRLYEIVCERHGGTINCHAGSAFNMPALTYATSLWDGEVFQSGFLHGKIDSLPDRYFRALYTGRNIGVPIFMLTYLNPPVWDFRMALATTLPFGIIPKVNDAGEPLEMISKIWGIYDRMDVENAEFVPYYAEGEHPAAASDAAIKVSAYRHKDSALLILSSTDRATDATFTLTSKYKKLYNAETGEPISEDGTATLALRGFDFLLIEARS